MKTMTPRAKQLLIELHKGGNSKTKQKLEQAFPELFTPFENGEWVKTIGGDTLLRITDFEKGLAYGFWGGDWTKESSGWTFKTIPERWQRVTEDEVISAFEKEFEKRGLKKGVKFKDPQCGTVAYFKELVFKNFFNKDTIQGREQVIYSNGMYIYKDGVFAEIVEEPKTIEKRVEFIERFICSNKYKVFRNGKFVELEETKTIEQRLELIEQFIKELKNK